MSASGQSRRLSRRARLVALLAAAVLVFAACGSDDDGDSDAVDAGDTPATENGTGTDEGAEDDADDGVEDDGAEDDAQPAEDADVTVVAEDINFPNKEFTASAGEITIGYVNEGDIRHTLVIEGVDEWETLVLSGNGDTASGSVELEAGEYTLFCDVPGHRGAGMEGTLTVS